MYSSLYSILHPFIEAKATGALGLENKDGNKAELFLSDGIIVDCTNGKLSGVKAARMVAKWLSFDHDFREGIVPSESNGTDLGNSDYIDLLSKINAIVTKVNELVSHDSVRLKMQASDFSGHATLSNNDLKIAALLNGKRTIAQIISEAKVSEFDLVYTIYKFNKLGLVKRVGSHLAIEDAERTSLLESINEKLSGIVGPASSVILKEALDVISVEETFLGWRDVGKMVDAILSHLDGNERQDFSEWWRNQPNSSRTLDS